MIVINHNTCDHLRMCLATVQQEGPDEALVVDNASTDGSAEMTRDEFPAVRLIQSKANLGYGAASNLGIAQTRAKHILLLNSDTRLTPGVLTELKTYLEEQPSVGVVGPRILNPDGTWQLSCFPFPGTWGWFVENDPLGMLTGRIPWLRRRLLRYTPPESACPVPWVLGAALALRREAFEEAGGFDEAFFMYYEEVDLCYRLQASAWQTHYYPGAEIYHVGGVSTSKQRSDMLVENFVSTIRFYRRHYSGARLHTWLLMLRAKMWFKLVRDRARLAVMPESEALEEEVQAWHRALTTKQGRVPTQNPPSRAGDQAENRAAAE